MASVGKGRRVGDAEEFGLVLVGVAWREGHGNDAAEGARPERIHERREPVDQDHGVRAGAAARVLQVAQDAERAPAQLRVGDPALVALAGDVVDAASACADGVERFGKRRVLHLVDLTFMWTRGSGEG